MANVLNDYSCLNLIKKKNPIHHLNGKSDCLNSIL